MPEDFNGYEVVNDGYYGTVNKALCDRCTKSSDLNKKSRIGVYCGHYDIESPWGECINYQREPEYELFDD
jgi:hypothetical protein